MQFSRPNAPASLPATSVIRGFRFGDQSRVLHCCALAVCTRHNAKTCRTRQPDPGVLVFPIGGLNIHAHTHTLTLTSSHTKNGLRSEVAHTTPQKSSRGSTAKGDHRWEILAYTGALVKQSANDQERLTRVLPVGTVGTARDVQTLGTNFFF